MAGICSQQIPPSLKDILKVLFADSSLRSEALKRRVLRTGLRARTAPGTAHPPAGCSSDSEGGPGACEIPGREGTAIKLALCNAFLASGASHDAPACVHATTAPCPAQALLSNTPARKSTALRQHEATLKNLFGKSLHTESFENTVRPDCKKSGSWQRRVRAEARPCTHPAPPQAPVRSPGTWCHQRPKAAAQSFPSAGMWRLHFSHSQSPPKTAQITCKATQFVLGKTSFLRGSSR